MSQQPITSAGYSQNAVINMKDANDKVAKKRSQLRSSASVKKLNGATLRRKLQSAIDHNLISVYYQPQVNLKNGSSDHLEALVRWNDHQFGFISPAEFVPVAERTGLVFNLTHLVIQQVARDIASWTASGLSEVSVGINVSARHFSSEQRAQQLIDWLVQANLPARCVTLELTETALLDHRDIAISCMETLRAMGFRIALDDFGSGYSSLTYLLEFPVDAIKFDSSFISHVVDSFKCKEIICSFLSLARKLDVEVVVEGVENPEQVRLLKQWGCTLVQGFYFAKALPLAETVRYLHSNKYHTLTVSDLMGRYVC